MLTSALHWVADLCPCPSVPSWVSTIDSQSTAGTFNGVVTVIICNSYLIKRGTSTAGKVSENGSSGQVETQQNRRSREHAERNITRRNVGEVGKKREIQCGRVGENCQKLQRMITEEDKRPGYNQKKQITCKTWTRDALTTGFSSVLLSIGAQHQRRKDSKRNPGQHNYYYN